MPPGTKAPPKLNGARPSAGKSPDVAGRISRRRPLSEVARHVVAPDGISASEWPSVRKTCRNLGWGFDGWQDGAAMLILSLRDDGEYASDTILVSIPRQVGKTYLIACIIFALCLMKPGLRVIWTAQVKDTALETFEQFFEMSQRPKVKPHVLRVRQGKGDESIIFANRSSIEFGARDSGFGRGRTDVDILVFDEGQHLTTAALENMGAAQNVAKNPLFFVMGTPPRPQDRGEFFTLARQEALDGDSDSTLFIEMSADRDADPMDREQWRKANPSFPHRTSERAMLRLRKKLKNDESWRREALGIWDEITRQTSPIPATPWSEAVDVGPALDERPRALAVDMSHERHISVAACWLEGETAHVEEVLAGPDPDAVVEWIVRRAGRRIPVVIDGASPAAALAPILRARRVHVKSTTAPDMARACGQLVDKLGVGRLTHADQEPINEAVIGARKRAIGTSGGWGYDRSDQATNIAPLVAATLALFGALMSRRPLRRSSSEPEPEPTRPTRPTRRARASRPTRATRTNRERGRGVISG